MNSEQKEIFISQDFFSIINSESRTSSAKLLRTEGNIYFTRLLPNSRKYLFHKTSISIINSEQKEIFISQDFCQYN